MEIINVDAVVKSHSVLETLRGLQGKLVAFEDPGGGELTPEGTREVMKAVDKLTGVQLPWDYDFSWVLEKRDQFGCAGNLPKRISSYLYKQHSRKLSNEEMSEIGNIARPHSTNTGSQLYYVSFDPYLYWHDGAFGDYHTCFQLSKRDVLPLLQERFTHAVKFWLPSLKEAIQLACTSWRYETSVMIDNYNRAYNRGENVLTIHNDDLRTFFGWGRAWLIPDHPMGVGTAALFNTYPPQFGLLTVARIVAGILGTSYQKYDTMNWHRNEEERLMWVNAHASVILAATERLPASGTTIKLKIGVNPVTCSNCGDELDRGETSVITVCNIGGDHAQRRVCRNCIEEYYRQCSECHDWVLVDNMSETRVVHYDYIGRETIRANITFKYLPYRPHAGLHVVEIIRQTCPMCSSRNECEKCGTAFFVSNRVTRSEIVPKISNTVCPKCNFRDIPLLEDTLWFNEKGQLLNTRYIAVLQKAVATKLFSQEVYNEVVARLFSSNGLV